MVTRQKKLRAFAGGLAAIVIMSNISSLRVDACELNQETEAASEQAYSVERTDEGIVVHHDGYTVEMNDKETKITQYITIDDLYKNEEQKENQLTVLADESAETSETVETSEAAETAETAETAEAVENTVSSEATEERTEEKVVEANVEAPTQEASEASSNSDEVDKTDEAETAGDKDNKPQEDKKEPEKENKEFNLENMTLEEMIDFYLTSYSMKDTNVAETAVDADIEQIHNKEGFDVEPYAKKYSKKLVTGTAKSIVDTCIKALPYHDLYGEGLNKLFGSIFGYEMTPIDLDSVIQKNKEETKDLELSMKREFDAARKENVDVTTLENYGKDLDAFTSKATLRAKAIEEIREDKDLNDAQKAVQIADLIGSTSEWRTGTNNADILVAMTTAAQCFQGGSDTDISSRDLYQAFYEFNSHNSIFAGEAMHKSEGCIQKRVKGFIRNCNVVVECFKAHKQVCELTDEQVATLDPQTKAIYDRIKADNKNIVKQIKNIASILVGGSKTKHAETGIFEAAKKYYEKDKTVYINHGTQNIDLADQLEAKKGADYQWKDFTSFQQTDYYVNKAGLDKKDIEKIVNQAKNNGMTLVEYLEYSGFDTSNLSNGIIAVEAYDDRPGSFCGISDGSGTMGVNGYKIDSKNGEYVSQTLSEHTHYHLIFGQYSNDNRVNSDINLVNFAPDNN